MPGSRAFAGAAAFSVVLALLVPLALAAMLFGPADASAVAANSEGGLRGVPPRPMPTFDLTDQPRWVGVRRRPCAGSSSW